MTDKTKVQLIKELQKLRHEYASIRTLFSKEITEHKRAEEALRKSEKQVRRKLNAILSPEANISILELSDIIDSEKIQKLMDE